ncbi:hypothetical protein [Desulfosarcina ovata]|uniref:Uncharacterized protein n=1 Tax=Desulfosarcina ovata subsp. ovata TaxID=2752305 RepID=A0A5K8A393_9BACT|nr:hypothetical protein [Desulfosarcina ovata]BBO87033.1 hypothetical protein DSCOOX_02130 [Desulfosarcina ovata subsp. ovata]
MNRVSINGLLKPTTNEVVKDQYLGHFLKISYTQEISGNSIYSKDRTDVEENGAFRFFLPKEDLLSGQNVTIEVFAPDGDLLGKQVYSYGSLHAANIAENAEDDTQPFEIQIDPKVIQFNQSNPVLNISRKISGRVVDISGENRTSGLQIVIVASNNPEATLNSQSFQPIFTAQTNNDGYFFGQIDNKDHEQAYGLIAGLSDEPIQIELENKKIPKNLLLLGDLSGLPADVGIATTVVPTLPDASELVGNTSFSQDIGGKCVDFTIPNRTLEEFSFYHTVRTTEPEIRGLTITALESKRLKTELLTLSDDLFAVLGRINSSMGTLNLVSYSVDEDSDETTKASTQPLTGHDETMPVGNISTGTNASSGSAISAAPVYRLKLDTGVGKVKFSTVQLKYDFGGILKLLAEQAKRKAKLQQLHYELAAAYCGKQGAPQAKTYCETLISQDFLNRASVESLLGHIKQYIDQSSDDFFQNISLPKQLVAFVENIKETLQRPFVDAASITIVKNRTEKLIEAVDKQTVESQDQEELLGYLRRLISELAEASEYGLYNFEPCPPRKTQTMGVMCMLQQFEDTRDTLRNKSVLSLGEILTIRANYDTYIISISSFLYLLEKFHSFYNGSSNFLISLEDDYFVKNYDSIRVSLSALKRQIYVAINHIEAIESAYISDHPGRKELSIEASIDWDETPTIYENTTIAHGHILHFKQQWKADGYSLGDLLYSLPLAPCQEKQIAIVDWDREERAARSEGQTVSESLAAGLSHDRDISEIINSSFRENISASSYNKTSGTSAGIGGGIFGAIGGLFGGVSHSGASSKSTATQNSARNLSGSTLNRLQDTISQSASSLRTQRNTVIQTVGQNETVSVQTEVVKNNNHCHAITIEYFEVLRHYAIEQELVDVQECLFVPLPMSLFDHPKILRWKNTLRRVIYGMQLRRGFDAIERISNHYADSDFPIGSYADETIEDFTGNFSISFELQRPYISEIEEATKTEKYDLNVPFPWFFGVMKFSLEREVPLTEAEKDAIFEAEYAPEIVRTFIDKLDVYGIAEDGSEARLDLDVTLLSNYRHGVPLTVNIAARTVPTITRRQIKHLRFRANTPVKASSRIILRSVYLYYRTKHLNEAIIRNSRINNDIINTVEVHVDITTPPFIEIQTKTDAALMYTPLNAQEQRNPRKEDQQAAAALLSYLNEHLELAHKAIWSSMDASRLFGLLDGYIAPNSGYRSVASVVENKIMGIVGNNLVLKVVPGERLDPVFRSVEDLIAYYQPTTKPDPFRISVPTKGVYAESVMGKCNSCEEIDETRHWRFDDVPCGTKPTAIDSVSTESRRGDTDNLQVKDLPSSIINMQNAPNAPDPTGLGAAFNLLGKSDVFKDMTGLAGTQANAIEALKTTSKSVTDLAGMAADLKKQESMKKDIGKTLKTVSEAEKNKQITKDQANKLAYSAISSMVGEPTKKQEKGATNKEVEQLTKTAGQNKASIKVTRSSGEKVEVDARKTAQDSATKPVIFLTDETSSADHRAFKPSANDKSLVIDIGVGLIDAPSGSHLQWSADPNALKIDNPNSPITRVRGIKPGKQTLTVKLLDAGGNQIAIERIQLSVPQCVTVTEDKALFDEALTSIKLPTQKNAIVDEMKKVVEYLLSKSNVRVFWKVGSYSENVPAHVPASNVVVATVKNNDPSSKGQLGVTSSATNADTFNETIEIYPGMYDEPDDIDVDTETQALILQIKTDLPGHSNLISVATKVYGRLIGETLSHEIGHALLWDDIPGDHNSPAIVNDIMNKGVDRIFKQRTGMDNTVKQSPVKPEHYKDYGVATINTFQAVNQGRIDNQWPVPPAFT